MKIASYLDFEGESFSVKTFVEVLDEMSVSWPNARIAMRDNKLFFIMDDHNQESLF